MGSSGKKKTTMAKHARENRLRERRLNKQAKRDARKQMSSDHPDAHAQEVPPDEGMAQPHRLRDARDEELAVFEGKLQANALEAGATEQQIRDAQSDHPGHNA